MQVKSPRMPSFSKSHSKHMARELHISFLFPLITGNLSIPDAKGYWYLCNEQDNTKGSEIYQLTKELKESGGKKYIFARPEQCYGVDRSSSIIKKNKKLHPDSNWLDGEWNAVLQSEDFDPALVYLDTTSFADKIPAVQALKETLRGCNKNTLVIANVMMNNARAGSGDFFFDKEALIDNLLNDEHAETFANWNISPKNKKLNLFHSYEYRTRKTLMRSYIFFKGVLPCTSLIINEFNKFSGQYSFSSQTHQIA